MLLTPREHQIKGAVEGYEILKQHMIVYLEWEERTGKTITAILIGELAKVQNILVITKKKALGGYKADGTPEGGWIDTLDRLRHEKNFEVVNYHQLKHVNPGLYDMVILDEAHSYVASFPGQKTMWKQVKLFAQGIPIIYLSATSHAQGTQMLYNQFALSDWSPFAHYSTPYNWHRRYGIPDLIYVNQRYVETYKKAKTDEVLAACEHLFTRRTRKDLGFEHEPTDVIHYIDLSEPVKDAYNLLQKHKILEINGHELVCDTSMKLRTSLHMLEGGVMKVGTKKKPLYVVLGNTEKIDFIMKEWGDNEDVVIMYQYIAEGTKLRKAFKFAEILQATSFAEGVDLSHKRYLIIYSQDFSTSKHSQRRARQANMDREEEIIVHFLLVKKAISDQVYKTVTINKENFIDATYTEQEL